MSTDSSQLTDRELIAQMIAGKNGAYEGLFRRYYAPLCGFAMKYVRDELAAEDIVQEVFYKLWNKREKVHPDTEIKPYLYVATKNTCLNYLKTSGRNVDVEESSFNAYFVEERDAADELEFDELEATIHEAIDQLPPKCREVFMLSRFEELSYKEIAERLEISVKTVENQMGKALRKLRESLGRYMALFLTLIALNFFS